MEKSEIMQQFMQLAKMLASLQGQQYQGALIARATWRQRYEDFLEPGVYIRHKGARHQRVECLCLGADAVMQSLDVMLFLAQPQKLLKEKRHPVVPTGLPWRSFSVGEITAFVQASGDTNIIHTGEQPVVPGLLILSCLLAEHSGQAMEIRFYQPLLAGEQVFLQKLPDRFCGYTKEQEVFVVRMEREKKER